MNVLAGLIFGAFVVAPAVALARGPLPYAATPLELMALPEYCRVRLAPADQRDPQMLAAWTSRLGNDVWLHIHHYCHGMKFTNRAQATMVRQDKRYYLQQAVGEFNYVLNSWPKDAPLRADAAMRKQMAEMMLKMP